MKAKVLRIIICAVMLLMLSGCKKKETVIIKPQVSSSADVYREPAGNGGTGETIIGDIDDDDTSTDSRFNYISTSEIEQAYEYEFDGGNVTIMRYIGDEEKVTIPSVIDGRAVTRIEDHAFRGSDITSVVIPSSVKVIGTHSFSGCDFLEQLTISDGVQTIEGYAFASCPNLAIVTLPDSLREIAVGAFRDCPQIRATYKGETYTAVDVEKLYEVF